MSLRSKINHAAICTWIVIWGLTVMAEAVAATAFPYKQHAPGLGSVICYYKDQQSRRHVITLPNGSTCPSTIEVD